ncbi:hypothetical protein JCM8547_007262 [Rhodosporidiobolus lusitaniae]
MFASRFVPGIGIGPKWAIVPVYAVETAPPLIRGALAGLALYGLTAFLPSQHDAIVNSGILIKRRYDIPEDLIPRDSRDEIDAKFAAGYWFATQVKELSKTAGRLWEDLAH